MNNEWDEDLNLENLTQEERSKFQRDAWVQQNHQDMINREQRRRAHGYFTPTTLTEDEIRDLFPWHRQRMDQDRREHDSQNNNNNGEQFEYYRDNWSANKVIWVCHGCGCFGYKQGDTSELFKCYACKSRNVTICRCGEISRIIRDSNVGIKMTDVYQRRKERFRERRRNARDVSAF